jgi:hypothetical protein
MKKEIGRKKRRKLRKFEIDESVKKFFPPVSPMGPGYPMPWTKPDIERQGKLRCKTRRSFY